MKQNGRKYQQQHQELVVFVDGIRYGKDGDFSANRRLSRQWKQRIDRRQFLDRLHPEISVIQALGKEAEEGGGKGDEVGGGRSCCMARSTLQACGRVDPRVSNGDVDFGDDEEGGTAPQSSQERTSTGFERRNVARRRQALWGGHRRWKWPLEVGNEVPEPQGKGQEDWQDERQDVGLPTSGAAEGSSIVGEGGRGEGEDDASSEATDVYPQGEDEVNCGRCTGDVFIFDRVQQRQQHQHHQLRGRQT